MPPASATTFADVPTSHWAYSAVQYVTSRSWITPYSNGFRPDQLSTRFELARAFTAAFAPSEPVDPSITFTDLPATSPGYAYKVANIAVKKGWLSPINGAFVATCHSGVTLAANHALAVAPMIAAGRLDADLDVFSARRFDVSKARSA